MVALREAALLAECNPKVWALYGAACVKVNRLEEAQRAFGQALFFRQRDHDVARSRTLRSLIARLGLDRAA